jgi:hypothetical protein
MPAAPALGWGKYSGIGGQRHTAREVLYEFSLGNLDFCQCQKRITNNEFEAIIRKFAAENVFAFLCIFLGLFLFQQNIDLAKGGQNAAALLHFPHISLLLLFSLYKSP